MDCNCIKVTSLPHATHLFTEYLTHYDRVQSFYHLNPLDEQSFFKAAKTVQYSEQTRAAVTAVLEEQAARFGAGDAARRNIERFKRGAMALVTGQQVGLFGGPIFSIYKALTVARLADWLTSRGVDAVPVFWLATEDHDLQEINHAFLLDGDYQFHRVEDAAAEHPGNAPVGTVALSTDAGRETERAIELLPKSEWTADVSRALRDAYQPGRTFGDAFGVFMSRVLTRFGVIPFDPRHPQLRRQAAGVFRHAVESADELRAALLERKKELLKRGYHAQVHVSDQSTLLFMNAGGQRTALKRHNGSFVLGEEQLSKEELLARIEKEPEQFSPNVLLRPIVQDVLLPTVAYVGGPAELAYFAQSSVVFDRLVKRMPVIFPRASFTLLDTRAAELLAKYGLTVCDVLEGPQALRQKMAPHFLPRDMAAAFEKDESRLQDVLGGLQQRMEEFDPTLAAAAATAARKMTYQLAKIKRKAGRAAGLRNGALEEDAQLLENLVHPRKDLQERVYSVASFHARFGPVLFDRIYEHVSIRSGDHQVLVF